MSVDSLLNQPFLQNPLNEGSVTPNLTGEVLQQHPLSLESGHYELIIAPKSTIELSLALILYPSHH